MAVMYLINQTHIGSLCLLYSALRLDSLSLHKNTTITFIEPGRLESKLLFTTMTWPRGSSTRNKNNRNNNTMQIHRARRKQVHRSQTVDPRIHS